MNKLNNSQIKKKLSGCWFECGIRICTMNKIFARIIMINFYEQNKAKGFSLSSIRHIFLCFFVFLFFIFVHSWGLSSRRLPAFGCPVQSRRGCCCRQPRRFPPQRLGEQGGEAGDGWRLHALWQPHPPQCLPNSTVVCLSFASRENFEKWLPVLAFSF